MHERSSVWQVETKGGLIQRYKSAAVNDDNAPWRWLLSERSDRFDNAINYDWRTVQGIDLTEVDLVPDQITYGDGRTITFDYENRADVRVSYVSGQRVERPQRMTEIRVEGYGGSLLHTYFLQYTAVESTNFSLLQTVQKCDAAGKCLPATNFDWAGGPSVYSRLNYGEPGIEPELEAALASSASGRSADLDGDGRSEFILWDTGDERRAVAHGSEITRANLPVTAVAPKTGTYASTLDLLIEVTAQLSSSDPETITVSTDAVHRAPPGMGVVNGQLLRWPRGRDSLSV